jgi:hypothetical protein
MKKRLVQLTDELCAAIDAARGTDPCNPWLEKQLWKIGAIRKSAKVLGITKPRRSMDGRGKARQQEKNHEEA